MTIGNTSRTVYSNTSAFYYWDKFGKASPQGNKTVNGTKARVWNGADRLSVVPVRPRPKGPKRTYTIPVDVTDRRGKRKTILVTRSFYERTPPSRVEREKRNEPHAYDCVFTDYLDVKTRWYWPLSPGGTVMGDMSVASVSGWPTWTGVNTPPTFNANDQIKLILKLKEAIRGSDFNLAVFAAEGQQTMAMIASTAVRLAKAYSLTRKGQLGKAAQVLTGSRKNAKVHKPVGNNWLELQYGWLPLLGDVRAGAEQLAHILNAPKTKRYSVRIRKSKNYSAPLFGWNWSVAKASISRNLVAYLTEPESLLSSTGILDPELVAWELLPFSFVADWVIPVGDFLEARAYSRSLTGKFVTTDLSLRECKNITSQRRDPSEPRGHTVSANTASSKYLRVTRSISTTLDVPKPVVKPIKDIFSWKHMANSLALLVQTVKSPDSKSLDRKISRYQRRSNEMWNDIINNSRSSF